MGDQTWRDAASGALPADSFFQTSVIFFDTNVLLLPFQAHEGTFESFKDAIEVLVSAKRLMVPEQAVKEYLHLRARELKRFHDEPELQVTLSGHAPAFRTLKFLKHGLATKIDAEIQDVQRRLTKLKNE